MDEKDLLWNLYQENATHGRHHETLRATTANILLAVAGGAIAIAAHRDSRLSLEVLPLALFVVLIGLFGAFFSAKYHERFEMTMERARQFRDALEVLLPATQIKTLNTRADAITKKKHPWLFERRLYKFWIALHLLVAALGLSLVLDILIVDRRELSEFFHSVPKTYSAEPVQATSLQDFPRRESRNESPVSAAETSAARKGLTWNLLSANVRTGTVDVGCRNGCDAYNGDTSCATALPILCIKKSGPGFPLPLPPNVDDSNQYHRWSGGVVGTTKFVVPPATLSAADALCRETFGPDWRVAEFHDGWGWHFQAAVHAVGALDQTFWVHINDQPNATCWH
jgi:hypothetical protein